MNKILVPVDFSSRSEYAAKLAAKIGEKTSGHIYLLHMVEVPTGIIDMGAGSNFSIPESMMYIRKLRDKLIDYKERLFSADSEVTYAIRFENPHLGIQKFAEKIDADLIVMGSQGVSDFDEMIIGSNTEKTVRTSDIPVIVVKGNDENFNLKSLVFASNFKEENKTAFAKFLDFAKKFDANVQLLKVNTIGKFESTSVSKDKIMEFIKDFEMPNHTIHVYNDTSVVKGIVNFSRGIDADLIALCTHGRSGLSHLFNGSITKSLSKSVLRPVITFKI